MRRNLSILKYLRLRLGPRSKKKLRRTSLKIRPTTSRWILFIVAKTPSTLGTNC
jgi:hypothetical protein